MQVVGCLVRGFLVGDGFSVLFWFFSPQNG